ncbi:MFS transporter [Cellulomonas sp. ATA003]|uniref:MFS transporter n=1 Tax=Cellulomonas sp. ATA003 TaxID=3073064 RepID=UPI002872D400|nr:MFS transporter [Cellulomonas sp. ATA003]WNB85602.1 MFS transporter [Cellulomonas sp. ATA003]
MHVLLELRRLLRLHGFRRLFAVRLVSQAGDGMFQVGLATLFFFSPESAGTATGVAAAFAVLLLPFTVVGPWAGVLLDRWRRRQVLLFGNLVRVAIALVLSLLLLTQGVGPAVYVLALLNLSINRFLLSALSAGLPRVVDGPLLLTANSLTPTLGAGAAGVGGGIGLVLGLVLEPGRGKDATVLLCAALLFGSAAALATRLGRRQLGPDQPADAEAMRREMRNLAHGLVAGARHLVARRTPARALGVMATHRFLYGVTFIASILISRNLLAGPGQDGLAVFGTVLGASGVGFALAVVLTPVLSPRTGPHTWIAACLLLAALSQVLLTVTVALPAVLVGAGLLGLAAQGAKIAVDTIVQRDTADAYRGRAFALYDVLYNAAFVGAAALAALALPDTGYSRPVFAALAVAYVLAAVVYRAGARRDARVTPVVTTTPDPAPR